MTDPRTPNTLPQALTELAQERERVKALQTQMVRMREELEVLRGAAFHASTSRLMAEEELDDTRDRLQLALDAAQLALWEWTVATNDVYLDARWSELMGDVAMDSHCPLKELLSRIHPDDVAAFQKGLSQAARGQTARFSVQYRIRTLSDEWIWLESHGMVADQTPLGDAVRLIGVAADIQTRKRLQADTEAARQQAEVANRAKTEFLANVSHEVRTPLNGVMGLIRLLQDSPLSPEQQEWITLMDSSAHTLLGLLNDILDLSKIEAGKMSLEDTVFDVTRVVEQACAPLVAQARLKPLTFEVNIHPQLGEPVMGDPGRLRQVLANLLSNAVKFTPPGGHIRVAARPANGQGVVFEVQDTGIGIAPAQQTSIFEAFTQADASTTRKFGGTGLGLAISARLVEMMGGRIRLLSTVGQGSTFSFALPLRAPATQPGSPLSAPMELAHIQSHTQDHAGLHVLVAEDHPVNELLMTQLLKKLGCRVSVAHNGLEAVAAWKRGDIDLIMMDVQMPELNGLDATAEIRLLEQNSTASNAKVHTPIVAVTANAMSGDREKCMAAGMDAYASKPVSPQALMTAMTLARDISERWQTTSPAPDMLPPTPDVPRASTPAAATVARQGGPLNLDTLRHRLHGNETALRQLATALRQEIQQHLQALLEAQRQQDPKVAALSAHALKGALASITAQRAAALANGLELAARSGEWALFGRALPVLQSEIGKLNQALDQLAPSDRAAT
jgi:signal transduction histidine kinase/DNA-binding response OmpR family regulator